MKQDEDFASTLNITAGEHAGQIVGCGIIEFTPAVTHTLVELQLVDGTCLPLIRLGDCVTEWDFIQNTGAIITVRAVRAKFKGLPENSFHIKLVKIERIN